MIKHDSKYEQVDNKASKTDVKSTVVKAIRSFNSQTGSEWPINLLRSYHKDSTTCNLGFNWSPHDSTAVIGFLIRKVTDNKNVTHQLILE